MKIVLCPHFTAHVKNLDGIEGMLVNCRECGVNSWPQSESMDKGDWAQDPRFLMYAQHVRDELIPMLRGSGATLSLVPPDNQLDVKYAVELGYTIMLDKPIIAVVTRDAKMPDKLAKVADAIVEGEVNDPDFQARLAAAVAAVRAAQEDTQEDTGE